MPAKKLNIAIADIEGKVKSHRGSIDLLINTANELSLKLSDQEKSLIGLIATSSQITKKIENKMWKTL